MQTQDTNNAQVNYGLWLKQRGQVFYQTKLPPRPDLLTVLASENPKALLALPRVFKDSERLEEPRRGLILNLIKALGLDPRTDAGLLYLNLSGDQGYLAGSGAYRLALQQVCAAKPQVKLILVFGSTVFSGLGLADQSQNCDASEHYYSRLQLADIATKPYVLTLPSLEDLISYPELKRPAWQSMQEVLSLCILSE